jgi:glycosyltransferase involved in cell wall biosynthesis
MDRQSLEPSRVDAKLDLLDAVADWFVIEAERHLSRADIDSSLRCAHVAASVWMQQNRRLVVPRLEALIQAAAQRLIVTDDTPATRLAAVAHRPVCLHVMEEALAAGGLTAMATRWIRNDGAERSHCVALLGQRGPIPNALQQAVLASGGQIWHAPADASFELRARWLRSLCSRNAALVVLHTGVSDTVFGAALGTAGGPPVMLVNHAAHIFWAGATVADLVLNCRGSDLERGWTREHRGVQGATLPIPLDEPPPHSGPTSSEERSEKKRDLGMAADALVILTVGATFKYESTGTHDFVAALEGVLHNVPDAVLLAAGVTPDERWLAACARTQGRLRAIGPVSHSRVSELHAIADVYVEGFPFGTTTALLEAGLQGLPAVLAPASVPPPYGTDGIALDEVLVRPATVAAYQQMLLALLADREERLRIGKRLAQSIRVHHTGSGWGAHLQRALHTLPAQHRTRAPSPVTLVERPIYERWVDFIEHTGSCHAELPEHAIVRARLLGLSPRLDEQFLLALRHAKSLRSNVGVPLPVLRLLLNVLLPRLPHGLGTRLFRTVAWLFRQNVSVAMRRRPSASRRSRGPRSWYEQYRDIET